jgi:hypothetical protein
MAHRPRPRIRPGDTFQENASGTRYRTLSVLTGELLLQPLHSTDPLDYITLSFDDLTKWTVIRPQTGKEVKPMPRTQIRRPGLPTLPKMTRAEWLKRKKAAVTLTKEELEQLARLIAAGHALLRNEPSVSPRLKGAMSRLGINTKGL